VYHALYITSSNDSLVFEQCSPPRYKPITRLLHADEYLETLPQGVVFHPGRKSIGVGVIDSALEPRQPFVGYFDFLGIMYGDFVINFCVDVSDRIFV
jgi:hypothetical protein